MSEVPPFEPVQDGPEYVYVQVANHIAARIKAGDLMPGARLPAERDLAAEYGVAYLTVRRAAQELRERGLIITVMGRGTFVAEPGEQGDGR
ncbi:GntR family transcriptional regulator [Actinomadura algeriensis]|uniref:DNA-binding GntR family transcriptional regulator n=1 Tax=Actinomadura algeriensis TaxID=1679523 RepID=A0ABR9JKR1_9ACTN|nr:winged helix-turn-helix domain-containing protein [Actinomadura algeriensis]MBE1531143.1 DNA-binding GntR family transcriptional regulator [Actinomadura algeriensis]